MRRSWNIYHSACISIVFGYIPGFIFPQYLGGFAQLGILFVAVIYGSLFILGNLVQQEAVVHFWTEVLHNLSLWMTLMGFASVITYLQHILDGKR